MTNSKTHSLISISRNSAYLSYLINLLHSGSDNCPAFSSDLRFTQNYPVLQRIILEEIAKYTSPITSLILYTAQNKVV
jgi:hypothetical protein